MEKSSKIIYSYPIHYCFVCIVYSRHQMCKCHIINIIIQFIKEKSFISTYIKEQLKLHYYIDIKKSAENTPLNNSTN